MSFSSELKEDLSKLGKLSNKEIVKYEWLGYLISNNTRCIKKMIIYTTENEYNINRFQKLLSNLNQKEFKIFLKGKKYSIEVPVQENLKEISIEQNKIQLAIREKMEEQHVRAFVRGIFLGGGSVNNPEKKYHLELIINTRENQKWVQNLLQTYQISMKELHRDKGESLYLKEGEEISKFLAFIEAHKGVLKFEEIRVLREVKNNVNRRVNCETANLNKTVNAAVRQMEAIEKIKKLGKFEDLPENLKEVAKLRMENPDASLLELGKMLEPPIGKSGVNHRFETLLKIAEE